MKTVLGVTSAPPSGSLENGVILMCLQKVIYYMILLTVYISEKFKFYQEQKQKDKYKHVTRRKIKD